jgi:hypothetical protein
VRVDACLREGVSVQNAACSCWPMIAYVLAMRDISECVKEIM